MREIFNNTPWGTKTISFFVALLLFSIFGPIQTSEHFNLLERLVFWSTNISGIGFMMHVVKLGILEFGFLRKIPRVYLIVFAVLVAAVPAASFFIFTSKLFELPQIQPDNFPEIWAQIVVVVLIIRLAEYGVQPEVLDPPKKIKPRLFSKLPADLQEAQIISLSMQDHYAEVTTTLGPHLVLIRFSDALALLYTIDGAQIHRSHWVAAAFAESLKKSGRRHTLLLSDGRILPVSASFLDATERLLETSP